MTAIENAKAKLETLTKSTDEARQAYEKFAEETGEVVQRLRELKQQADMLARDKNSLVEYIMAMEKREQAKKILDNKLEPVWDFVVDCKGDYSFSELTYCTKSGKKLLPVRFYLTSRTATDEEWAQLYKILLPGEDPRKTRVSDATILNCHINTTKKVQRLIEAGFVVRLEKAITYADSQRNLWNGEGKAFIVVPPEEREGNHV
jgi:hypothetical protein